MLLIHGSRLARELRRFSIWKSRRAYFPGTAARSTATIVSVQFQISSITWAACLSLKAIPNGQEIVRWHSCGSEVPHSACTRIPSSAGSPWRERAAQTPAYRNVPRVTQASSVKHTVFSFSLQTPRVAYTANWHPPCSQSKSGTHDPGTKISSALAGLRLPLDRDWGP
jgi:hypothetical protein